MPTRTGLTNTGPATAGRMSFSWKPSTSNGCRSSQPTKHLRASGRPFRINLPVKTLSLSTLNSHPSSDCELPTNPTSLPPSPSSTQNRLGCKLAALQHERPTHSPHPPPSKPYSNLHTRHHVSTIRHRVYTARQVNHTYSRRIK